MTRIFGHRGASGYAPENTIEAFRLAAEMGADGVELDVQMTRDGELVVAHDEEVGRVANGFGLICNMTLPELKKLRFNKTHPEYESAAIPTLRNDPARQRSERRGQRRCGAKEAEAGADPEAGQAPARRQQHRRQRLAQQHVAAP